MKTIKIPSEAILDLSTEGSVTPDTGDVIVFLDKISYMRTNSSGHGLIRMMTGVDINIKREFYEKIVDATLS
jgi:hypothetical protein